jgi:coenzyme Q-binding protein COQ10
MPVRTSRACGRRAWRKRLGASLRHSVVRILPYTPEQLFALVGDVAQYPQFVPWITSMRTWNARTESEGVTLVDAEAGVGFSFLRERFSTRVRRDGPAGAITVSLLHGPFRQLLNRWRFTPDPAGTRVDFEIDFEFKSRLLQTMLASNFEHAVDRLIGCFEARAKALYGPAAQP